MVIKCINQFVTKVQLQSMNFCYDYRFHIRIYQVFGNDKFFAEYIKESIASYETDQDNVPIGN